jgi:hypothetical protein
MSLERTFPRSIRRGVRLPGIGKCKNPCEWGSPVRAPAPFNTAKRAVMKGI